MAKKYQKQFNQFLSEVKLLDDAQKAKYKLSDEASNIILLSGEVIGDDTKDKIVEIGRLNRFIVLADCLSVIDREAREWFSV